MVTHRTGRIVLPLVCAAICIVSRCDSDDPVNPVTTSPGRQVSVGPSGGQFELAGGIMLDVPAGAVAGQTVIEIGILDSVRVDSVIQASGLTNKRLLVAFEAKPSGLEFAQPVVVTLPCPGVSEQALPIHVGVNLESGNYAMVGTHLIYSPSDAAISVYLQSFSDHAAVEVDGALTGRTCGGDVCRCGRIEVVESTSESIYQNGACQVSRTDGYVVFHDCAGEPREDWTFIEIDSNCVPALTIEAPAMVAAGGDAEIQCRVALNDSGLPDQPIIVFLAPAGLATVNPTHLQTSSDGTATTTFAAGNQDGVVTLTVYAATWYNSSYVSASGETIVSPRRYKTLRATATIAIVSCPEARELFAAAQAAYADMVRAYRYGSSWSVRIDEQYAVDAYDYEVPFVLSVTLRNDCHDGASERSATTQYTFAVPDAPPPFTCEEVSFYQPAIDMGEAVIEDIVLYLISEKLLAWPASQLFGPLAVYTHGSGTHSYSLQPSTCTDRYLYEAFCVFDNPCPSQTIRKSGCSSSNVAHTTGGAVGLAWFPGETLSLTLDPDHDSCVSSQLPLRQSVNYGNEIDWNYDGAGTDICASISPICLAETFGEDNCEPAFFPSGIEDSDSLTLAPGVHEFRDTTYSNDGRRMHTRWKKVTLNCVSGCP